MRIADYSLIADLAECACVPKTAKSFASRQTAADAGTADRVEQPAETEDRDEPETEAGQEKAGEGGALKTGKGEDGKAGRRICVE